MGYGLFRQENTQAFRDTGLKGNALSSKLGEAWRKLSVASRNQFNMKAYLVGNLNEDSNKLTKTSSVKLKRKTVILKKFSSSKC